MVRAASATFLNELKTNHVVHTRVEVLSGSTVVLSTDTNQELYVTDGEVTADRAARFRRQLTLTIADPKRLFLPTSASSYFHVLAPYDIKVYRGIVLRSGVIETFSQGVFTIADCEVHDKPGEATMTITAYDRMRRVERSPLTRPLTIAQNTNTVTAIQTLIQQGLGYVPPYVVTPTTYTTNFTRYEVQQNLVDAIRELAESIGYEVFFNCDGACVIRPQPDPATGAVTFTYAEGVDAIIGGIDRKLSNEEAYNGVFAYGQSEYNISPAFGEAWDTDPLSPTYSGYNPVTGAFSSSTYGRYPKFMEPNKQIKLTAQAFAAAQAELLKYLGVPENIEFTSVVNPIHEESDIIAVQRAAIGVNSNYVLERYNIPLKASTGMTARTRERRA